eukprot:4786436-Pyramimonas_sp.AAC.1
MCSKPLRAPAPAADRTGWPTTGYATPLPSSPSSLGCVLVARGHFRMLLRRNRKEVGEGAGLSMVSRGTLGSKTGSGTMRLFVWGSWGLVGRLSEASWGHCCDLLRL